jgi:hypothetical protein
MKTYIFMILLILISDSSHAGLCNLVLAGEFSGKLTNGSPNKEQMELVQLLAKKGTQPWAATAIIANLELHSLILKNPRLLDSVHGNSRDLNFEIKSTVGYNQITFKLIEDRSGGSYQLGLTFDLPEVLAEGVYGLVVKHQFTGTIYVRKETPYGGPAYKVDLRGGTISWYTEFFKELLINF